MALLSGLFGKKKELKDDEVKKLIDTSTALREPVIVQRRDFKYVSDMLGFVDRTFHVKNTLSRDEVLYQVKGHELRVSFPYELTMYSGTSRLIGLGLVNGIHTLKLVIPDQLTQAESRGAYRVSRFPETPSVTFTTDSFDIIKARLNDISMTGAGIRLDPRWASGNAKLALRLTIILDIRLNDSLRVSTTASVRYLDGAKMGVQFQDLGKGTKERLFKYIVAQRREEHRALIQLRSRFEESSAASEQQPSEPKDETDEQIEPGKPTALIVTDNQEMSETLTTCLTRKFDLIYAQPAISDIRNQLALNPDLCLIELDSVDQEQVRTMRKAGTLLPAGCVLMFFGMNFDETFTQRFDSYGYPDGILIDLALKKKLMVFKQIQAFYEERSPK